MSREKSGVSGEVGGERYGDGPLRGEEKRHREQACREGSHYLLLVGPHPHSLALRRSETRSSSRGPRALAVGAVSALWQTVRQPMSSLPAATETG